MPLQNRSGKSPGAMFYAAYVGPSMNPTLREPEMMEVLPYDQRPIRVGDVAFFLPPEADQPVVHRIVGIAPEGISTLGDNNSQNDAYLLQPENIQGRVVAAWRGQKRRKIAGGPRGRLISGWLRWRRALDRSLSPLLHPLYQTMTRSGWIARVLPARFRPRVVVFRFQGQDRLQLLLGRRIIGRYDHRRHQWQIQRAFQLLVDPRALAVKEDGGGMVQKSFREPQPALDHRQPQGEVRTLTLADGSHWEIMTTDEEAASVVSQIGYVMQLGMKSGVSGTSHFRNRYRLLVQVDPRSPMLVYYAPLASKDDGPVTCFLNPRDHWVGPLDNLVRISNVFARQAQANGGILIHGALAERDGMGVILTAPGGTGKTTASKRFPAPWHSLCDDTTLVVLDPQGNYWAHPWPTWSLFQNGQLGGSWDVQRAMPLKGIFLLAQAVEDRVERVGHGQAV
ncbi:MAG: SynChlorMet cassette protein ScmC, partial [Syntrophales bacterium LBB04]|nr:SynChlorMet cassette protein ScmC [Syntrophales bacterium LBB04]